MGAHRWEQSIRGVAAAADLSNDKKDSEQRQKKTEWTNPLRSKGWGAKKKKAAKKKTKEQMKGSIELAEEVLAEPEVFQ